MQLNQLFGQDFTIQDQDLKGFDKLPKGRYRVLINSFKPEQQADFSKLVYEAVVTDGECANRKIWLDFCTSHSNPKVVEIAMQNMKKFMVACGKRSAVNVEDALQTMPVIEVGYQKDKNDPSKEYARYTFLSADGQPLVYENAPVQQVQQQMQPQDQQTAQPQQQGQEVPPWMQ